MGDTTQILTLNAGSSSIKFALFGATSGQRALFTGRVERIGQRAATLVVQAGDEAEDARNSFTRPIAASNHAEAVASLIRWLADRLKGESVAAVGHRIVHGGSTYWQPQPITSAMLAQLRLLGAYDPDHAPLTLELMDAALGQFSAIPQIACFDTAFHHDMPRVATHMALPRRLLDSGMRRYGFHGLSCAYLMHELSRIGEASEADGRVILAHLGSGCSMTAVRNGHSVDTTMSLTPASGLMMGTRCGDVDSGLPFFLAHEQGLDTAQFQRMANHESGLLGMSGISADMRDLLACESQNTHAADAIALFCYQIRKQLGAFCAVLGGLDTLVFAGGIGEAAPVIRARICAGLQHLGIELDQKPNDDNAAIISAGNAPVTVRVIRTDEAWMIAQSVRALLAASRLGGTPENSTA